jgi:methionyl-tRNA formyltransferase
MNEILYFIIYRILFARTEQRKLRKLIGTVSTAPRKPLSQIRQYRASDINSEELRDLIGQEGIDAMFAMCIDVYLPQKLIDTPRLGTYLWHEGITPEYRGVHSPFWVLANQDYSNFGYTVLKLNSKFDAGDIYVQGRIDGIDPMKDLHCYIGHKAIIDSLSPVRSFFHDLEKGNHRPIQRSGAQDQYYSYPTGTKLLKIMANRLRDRIFKKRAKPVKSKKQQKFKRVLSTEPVSAAAALAANETRSAISDTK